MNAKTVCDRFRIDSVLNRHPIDLAEDTLSSKPTWTHLACVHTGPIPMDRANYLAEGNRGSRFSLTAATPSVASSPRKHNISMASDASKAGCDIRIQLFSERFV